MKKPSAVTLLISGDILATLAMGAAVFFLALWLQQIGIVIWLAVSVGIIAAEVRLEILYSKRGWLTPGIFWLCGAAPVLAYAAAVVSVICIIYANRPPLP